MTNDAPTGSASSSGLGGISPPAVGGVAHWIRVALESGRQSLALLWRGRITKLLLGCGAVFFVGLLFVPSDVPRGSTGEAVFADIAKELILLFVVPALVVWFGIQALASDRENRTATWLFARPVPRTALLVGKWGAAWLFGSLWAAAALTALYFGLSLPGHEWKHGLGPTASMCGAFAVGAVTGSAVYAMVGLLFAALVRRSVLAGLSFVMGWEVFAASVFPAQAVGVRAFTIADPMRRMISLWVTDDASVQGTLLPPNAGPDFDPGMPILELLRFFVIVSAVALVVFARREYDLRPKE